MSISSRLNFARSWCLKRRRESHDPKAATITEKELGPLTFGMFVKSMRTSLDLTQIAMARKLGMSRGTLCDIEKGRQLVSIALAKKIAKKAGFSETVAITTCMPL